MAHEGKSLPKVKEAMRKAWEAHLQGYLDDINALWGWSLPMPTRFVPRQIIKEPRGQAPIVGVYAGAQTPVKHCAGKRLKWDTHMIVEVMLTRDLVATGDDTQTFVDAFEEYQEALVMCLYKDQYDTGTNFLSTAGVEFIRKTATHFDPIGAGVDPQTSPVIRISQCLVVFRRHHKAY